MARIDVSSFKAGIAKKNKMIQKLVEQRDFLQKKLDNTVECPGCKAYWDALYVNNVHIEQGERFANCICPRCKTNFNFSLGKQPDSKAPFQIIFNGDGNISKIEDLKRIWKTSH